MIRMMCLMISMSRMRRNGPFITSIRPGAMPPDSTGNDCWLNCGELTVHLATISPETRKNKWFVTLDMRLLVQRKINWNEDRILLPKIEKLAVIPIRTHFPKPIRTDADALYRIMCETQIIPIDEYGRQIKVGEVCWDKGKAKEDEKSGKIPENPRNRLKGLETMSQTMKKSRF